MASSNQVGNALAITASLFQASVLVFWKYLLSIFPRSVLMTYWFGLASLILFLYLAKTKKLRFKIHKESILPLFFFGLLSALTSFLLMYSAALVGASITAFIMQTTAIFALLYSIYGLKEKFTVSEFIGILLIVAGLFILNWKAGMIITISSGVVLIAALSQSTNHFLAKKLLGKIQKSQLNFIRVCMVFLFGLVYLLVTREPLQAVSIKNALILILGVVLGPIMIYVFYYSALQKINLATASSLKSVNPVFTFILAFLF